MTPRQRSTYFGKLWPAACRAQKWKVSDDHQRRRVTFAATGETSTTDLDDDQITLLFIKLEHLADPYNYDKALADSDPAAALAANKRKKLIFSITKRALKVPGDSEAWLASIAADRHGTRDWRKLPDAQLRFFAMTVSERTTAMARERRAAKSGEKPAAKPRKSSAARAVQPACTVPLVFTAHPNGTIYIGTQV